MLWRRQQLFVSTSPQFSQKLFFQNDVLSPIHFSFNFFRCARTNSRESEKRTTAKISFLLCVAFSLLYFSATFFPILFAEKLYESRRFFSTCEFIFSRKSRVVGAKNETNTIVETLVLKTIWKADMDQWNRICTKQKCIQSLPFLWIWSKKQTYISFTSWGESLRDNGNRTRYAQFPLLPLLIRLPGFWFLAPINCLMRLNVVFNEMQSFSPLYFWYWKNLRTYIY